MIYSKVAIDYSKGVYKGNDGYAKAKKIGCYVMTHEECIKRLKKWEKQHMKV